MPMRDCSCAETSAVALLVVKTHRYFQHKYEALRAQKKWQGLIAHKDSETKPWLPPLQFLSRGLPGSSPTGLVFATERRNRRDVSAGTGLFIIQVSVLSFFPKPVSILKVSHFTPYFHLLTCIAIISCADPLVSSTGSVTWEKDPWL